MFRRAIPAVLVAGGLLLMPATSSAATVHVTLVDASIFTSIAHAVLGAFSWTISLASNFLLTTLAAIVKLLIPSSWASKGLEVMEWIVAVPDYAGKITAPGGGQEYGFAGINSLRELFMWLGLAVAPLSLTYATARAMIGESEPVAIPVLRVLAVAVLVASYPYWWSQAAALADQITSAILTEPDVAAGLQKLMQYAVDGVALGGWQLIDLSLMGAIGVELLGLIFLKVVLILLGALLYAVGPGMIALAATRTGEALSRAWVSAVTLLFALGIGWATVFAVGALLINDAGTAGPLIAGNSTFGSLMGGLMLALAGLASLWACLKVGREAGGLLRLQLAGLLAVGRSHSSVGASPSAAGAGFRTTGRSLREYGSRLARASQAAGGELAAAGAGGTALASAGRAAGYVGRRGLIGTAAAGALTGTQRASGPAVRLLSRSRAGAVAANMARAGTASWTQTRRPSHAPSGSSQPGHSQADRASTAGARVNYTPQSTPTTARPTRSRSFTGERSADRSRRASAAPSGTEPRSSTPTRPASRSASAHPAPSRAPGPSSQGTPRGLPTQPAPAAGATPSSPVPPPERNRPSAPAPKAARAPRVKRGKR